MGLVRQKPPPPPQPADLVREWTPIAKEIDPAAELDFSFARDAITICDMRTPNALKYCDLFTRRELEQTRGFRPTTEEVERRIRKFMR